MSLAIGALVAHLRTQFQLDWNGLHGASHWARVRRAGLELARHTGADPLVVELFAWLHDARRWNEGHDPGHGARAAELAVELPGTFYELDERRSGLLVTACTHHSDGRMEGDVTVLTCWDADRLDLGRIGVRPDPGRLCTQAARQEAVIRDAWERSRRWARRVRG